MLERGVGFGNVETITAWITERVLLLKQIFSLRK